MSKNNNNKKKQNNGWISLLLSLIIVFGAIITIVLMQNNKEDDKTLAYTDLIKQISEKNVEKVEMTTGSTSVTVTLKKEINENGEIVENGVEYNEEQAEQSGTEESKQINEKLVKSSIVPNTQTFMELIQAEVENGNDIELIQESPSMITRIPSYII